MKFGFVRLGLWRVLLGVVTVLGIGLCGVYIYRAATGQGLGMFGGVGMALVILLLAICAITALLFSMLEGAFAEVRKEGIRVKMGWLLDFTIPLVEVRQVCRGRHSFLEGVGVRTDFSGGLAVVSACRNIVELELGEPIKVEMKLFPWRVSLRHLNPRFPLWGDRIKLSLREPERFIAEVENRLETEAAKSISGGKDCAS